MKTAVVIGSTGLIGENLCESLALSGEYAQVLAICRSPRVWANPRIKNVKFGFENWAVLTEQIKNFAGSESVHGFCTLGTTMAKAKSQEQFKKIDLDYVVQFAEVLNQLSASKLFVVSALGANSNSEVFYNKIKGQMEEQVVATFRGIAIFLRPSLLLGDRKEFRLGERAAVMLAPLYSFLFKGPLKKFRPIEYQKISQAIVNILKTNNNLKTIYENDEIHEITKASR